METFAIFRVGASLQIGRIKAGCNFASDQLHRGPYATYATAETVLEALLAEGQARHAS